MKLSLSLPPLAVVACLTFAVACGDDDATNGVLGEDPGAGGSQGAGAGHPAVLDVDACEMLTEDELTAADVAVSGEPLRTGEVGDDLGNTCTWGAKLTVGTSRGSIATDADPGATESTLDGRRVLRLVDDDPIGASCQSKIEVTEQVYVFLRIEEGYCDPIDQLLPLVSSRIPAGDGAAGDEGAGDQGDDGGDGAQGATVPADADVTSELLCTTLSSAEIPAPGFAGVEPVPQEGSTADAACDWDATEVGQVYLWYTSIDNVSATDPPLDTDGREGTIELLDAAGECLAQFVRAPGTVVIEVTGVDDLCGVAEQIARTLAPRFPQAG